MCCDKHQACNCQCGQKMPSPCPFCGMSNIIVAKAGDEDSKGWAVCTHCHAEGPLSNDPIGAWNIRVVGKAPTMDELKCIQRITELGRQRDALAKEADKYRKIAKRMSISLSNIRNCDSTPKCSRDEAQQALEEYVQMQPAFKSTSRKVESLWPPNLINNETLIKMINAHQHNPNVHPLTCGNDSEHLPLYGKEIDGKVVLVCPNCDYIQKHIPPLFPMKEGENVTSCL